MREILFRGKRVDNGEWVYGDLTHISNGKVGIWGFDNNQFVLVNPSTVGQYTGRNDKNGNKTFKGDIATYAEEGIRGDFSQGVMEIVWDEKTAKFCGRTKQGRLVETANSKNVIGNIYDNPELLEVE